MVKRLVTILFVFIVFVFSAAAGPRVHSKPKKYPNFTRTDSLHGYLSEYRRCYDVQFYDIDLDINPEKKYFKGAVTMIFLMVNPEQNVLQIDLDARLSIDSITIDGNRCEYSREYNAVFVSVPHRLSENIEHEITCWYQGKPVEANLPPWEGGTVWKTSKSGKPWFGVTCETLGASCWIPCKDHLSDEPERGMRMKLSVPKDLTAVSNGVLLSHETTENKEIWTWQTNYTINSYNITFYVGDFVKYSEEYKGVESTFMLEYYVLPEDLEKSKKSFAQTKDVIAAYEDFYGPYPWAKENFKLIESPYEGMEHQTAIAYGNGFKNMFDMDYIIVHEAAHEWWGNTVSVDDYAEVFIHEGFAMYSEFLYVERMFGTEKRDTYVNAWKRSMKNIRPVVGPRDVNFWDYSDTDPYVKGAWTLHGLRYVMDNDSLFFDILKSYNLSRRNSIVTVKDFTDYVNEKTGEDYSWYFKQYLYDERIPTLQYRWIPREEMAKYRDKVSYMLDFTDNEEELAPISYLQLKWTNVDSDFKMPVSFIMKDSTGNNKVIRFYVGNGLRKNQISNIPVTTDGIVVKRYGNPNGGSLYFNTSNFYYELENVKKLKNNGTKNNNNKRNRR
ncbi:MAG: M1 family metallopeptidase [Bacteroidales bacterium]|nr:M1 family metallopeptidase [Bacteroidales bacterium]